MDKIIYRVPDMHCPNCVMHLEGLEDDLPGVRRVTASYRTQQMEVEYDGAAVSPDQIAAAIADLGYTVADARMAPLG